MQNITKELISQIRDLHFQTKKLTDETLLGEYKSAFRGRGIEFEEVREYVPGDDIRSIDWKVTARSNKPFIKSFREERELTVMIAVDISGSTFTGSCGELRESLIAKAGAVLTLTALKNNDKVGLVTFSDKIDSYHPPRKARGAVWRILHEVLAPKPQNKQTDLSNICSFLSKVLKRNSVIFIISDFLSPPESYEKDLAVLTKRHDVTVVTISDPLDDSLPNAGLVEIINPETGLTTTIDSSNENVRQLYQKQSRLFQENLYDMFIRHAVAVLPLTTKGSLIDSIRRFFHSKASVTTLKASLFFPFADIVHDKTSGFHDIKALPTFTIPEIDIPWVTIFVMISILSFIFFYLSRRNYQTDVSLETPIDQALRELNQELPTNSKEVATYLSLSLRRYIENTLSIPATEQTNTEIKSTLPDAMSNSISHITTTKKNELISTVLEILNKLNAVTYQPSTEKFDEIEFKNLVTQIKNIIKKIDNHLLQERNKHQSIISQSNVSADV